MSLLSIGNITKLAGLLSIGKGIIDKTVFQRLLTGIAAVAGLSIIVGMLVGTLLLMALYGIYHLLVYQAQLPENLAMLTIALIIAVIAGFLIYKIIGFIKKIATFSAMLSSVEDNATPMNAIQAAFYSFLNGLKGKAKNNQPNNKFSNIKKFR